MNNDVLMEKLVQLEAKLDAVHADVKKGNADPILPCGPDDAAKVPPWTSEWIEKVLYTPAQLSAACPAWSGRLSSPEGWPEIIYGHLTEIRYCQNLPHPGLGQKKEGFET